MKEIFMKEAFGIIRRLRKRDFSGYTGMAVKNSIFNFSSALVLKLGSLLFTVIIARMLLPDLFGLYSLALSTIVFLSAFSDLGVGTALVNLVSKELVKKNNNSGAYVKYLFRIKMGITIVTCAFIMIAAYFLANFYYKQPIFLALFSGAIYILVNSLISFYSILFQAINKFQITVYKEVIFQIARIICVPLAILLAISYSSEIKILAIFLALSLAYALSLIYLYAVRPNFKFKRMLTKQEKSSTLNLVLPLTATIVSGIFFGYIDMIILGRYVQATYIGYYSAAMALIGSVSSLIGFSAAIFPIFSRLNFEKLKLGLKKAVAITIPISILAIVGTLIFSKYVILIIYGKNFLPSLPVLEWLSLILIIDPLIAIYSNYHIVLRNQNFVATTLVITTILNIILNITFITYALNHFSPEAAIIGAALATITARAVYLFILILKKTHEIRALN